MLYQFLIFLLIITYDEFFQLLQVWLIFPVPIGDQILNYLLLVANHEDFLRLLHMLNLCLILFVDAFVHLKQIKLMFFKVKFKRLQNSYKLLIKNNNHKKLPKDQKNVTKKKYSWCILISLMHTAA